MGKTSKRWVRILALCLALACLVGTVAAAANFDLNGDGKVNILDAQAALGIEDVAVQDVVNEILGGGDELHPDEDNTWHIDSVLGLFQMAKNAGNADYTYVLEADIDLNGIAWTPVAGFAGNFDGNGKTISNFKITEAVNDSTAAKKQNMGFFGDSTADAEIKNLHLENFTIDATNTGADYVGAVVGTNLGAVTGCTVDGAIVDARTGSSIYRGLIAGQSKTGTVELGTVTTYAYQDADTTVGTGVDVAAIMYLDLAEGVTIDFVGSGAEPTGFWRDNSNSTELQAQFMGDTTLLERRQTAVDHMREQATVIWTTDVNMVLYYFKSAYSLKNYYDEYTWLKSDGATTPVIQKGIPYTHGGGGMDRFMAQLDENNVVKDSVPKYAYYITNSTAINQLLASGSGAAYNNVGYACLPEYTGEETLDPTEVLSKDHAGFCRYMGNDCSSSIAWAWRQVSSVVSEEGGTSMCYTEDMIPIADYTEFGVLPVDASVTLDSVVTVGRMISLDNLYDGGSEDGVAAFMESYAKSRKGDAIVGFNSSGGHSRLIAYDPVVIRDQDGAIDRDQSYMVTIEQGRSSSSRKDMILSTWTVDYVYTFGQLMAPENYPDASLGSMCRYLPLTIAALNEVDTEGVVPKVSLDGTTVTSNFYIVSTTVNGNEEFTAVAQHAQTEEGDGYRDVIKKVDLAKYHEDLTGGKAEILLSNGQIYDIDLTAGTVTLRVEQ